MAYKDNNTLLREILDAVGGGGGGGGGHKFVSFSIPTSAWREESDGNYETNYKATITASCGSSDGLQVYYSSDCVKYASDCGIVSEIGNNSITFFAEKLPQIDIAGRYEILESIS